MGDRVLVKVLLLSFSLRSSADTHSLQHSSTSLRPGIKFSEFIAVGLLDGEQVLYYDSKNRKLIPKTEWMKNISTDYPDHWNKETEKQKDEQDTFKSCLPKVMKCFNKTEGVHTLQRMYGCELHDDNTTRLYDQFGYDGEDFISLDLNTGTWTADKPEAEIFINQWDPTGYVAKKQKSYLETECIYWMKKFLSYGRETLERKDPPTSSVFQKLSPSPEVVCHTTGFFPKEVKISWRKDGENVTENVELRETLPNQDGSFQKRIILKVPAEDLQKHKYTCVIQHSSLKEEMVLKVPKDGESGGRSDEGSGGESGGGLGGGIIAGVVVTVVLALLVSAGIMVWTCRRRRSGERRQEAGIDIEVTPLQDGHKSDTETVS